MSDDKRLITKRTLREHSYPASLTEHYPFPAQLLDFATIKPVRGTA